jgi:hypothetical protein
VSDVDIFGEVASLSDRLAVRWAFKLRLLIVRGCKIEKASDDLLGRARSNAERYELTLLQQIRDGIVRPNALLPVKDPVPIPVSDEDIGSSDIRR